MIKQTVTQSGFLKKDLTIFHQNIRGMKDKTEEIVNNIATNPPQVLCFTEHHLEFSPSPELQTHG